MRQEDNRRDNPGAQLPYSLAESYGDDELVDLLERILNHLPPAFQEIVDSWALDIPHINDFLEEEEVIEGMDYVQLHDVAFAIILYHLLALEGREGSLPLGDGETEAHRNRFEQMLRYANACRAEEMERKLMGEPPIPDNNPALTRRVREVEVPYTELFGKLTGGNQQYVQFLIDTTEGMQEEMEELIDAYGEDAVNLMRTEISLEELELLVNGPEVEDEWN